MRFSCGARSRGDALARNAASLISALFRFWSITNTRNTTHPRFATYQQFAGQRRIRPRRPGANIVGHGRRDAVAFLMEKHRPGAANLPKATAHRDAP